MNAVEATKILEECYRLAEREPAQRPSGCGRVYIVPVGKDAKRLLKAAAKRLGKRYIPRVYGIGSPALYYGYDNCTGITLARGERLAKELNARGISCYQDAVGD